MYTSYIGKNFLHQYNQKNSVRLSAEVFFIDIFFPLFFRDGSHLMHVSNSPFFQNPKPGDVTKYGSRSLAQLNNLKSNIETDIPNMSIFVGAAAKDVGGTTSGQLTDIEFNVDKDDMYASWIGAALAIGVNGGFVMLIDDPEILWNLFEGWSQYRKYLSQTPGVKDKQIETWNGQWLSRCLDASFDKNNPFDRWEIETTQVQENIAIPTQQWSKVIFALSKKFPTRIITAYCYNLSQTNTTLGFINIYLREVRKFYELRDELFIDKAGTILSDKEIDHLSTFYNFKSACQIGTIGLKALEPDKLREYMPKGSILYAQGKEPKFSGDESHSNYTLFKIWIIAMLNKTDLLHLASNVASSLIDLEKTDQRGKTTLSTLSKEVRESKNLKGFVESLTVVLSEQPTNNTIFKEVVEQVLKMPSDNFPLFVTLIRFEYAYQKTK